MRRTLGVGVVLLLAILFMPSDVWGQQSGERAKSRLGANYPNPFNPETRIPFDLFDEDFVGGRPVVVSIRIRSVMGEVVAIPAALNHPDGNGVEVNNLQYTTPGEKTAYWNGLNRSGRKVASGIYYVELVVNGERAPPRQIVVAK
ncbi:hypothetical protein BH23GEM9_BH23GEM9_14290 [soil metagenome]